MKQKDKKISQKIIFLLFSTFFLVGLFTFKDYGISVDEEFQRSSGFYWLNYISEFDKNSDDKYKIPYNFSKIDEFILNNTIVYQVFKKNN